MSASLKRPRSATHAGWASTLSGQAWEPNGFAAELLAVAESPDVTRNEDVRRRVAQRVHLWTSCGVSRLVDEFVWQSGREAVRRVHKYVAQGVRDPKYLVIYLETSASWLAACVGAIADIAEKSSRNAQSLAKSLNVLLVTDATTSAAARRALSSVLDLVAGRYGMSIAVLDVGQPECAAWRGAFRPSAKHPAACDPDRPRSRSCISGLNIICGGGHAQPACLRGEGPWLRVCGLVNTSSLFTTRRFCIAPHKELTITAEAGSVGSPGESLVQEWKDALAGKDENLALLCVFEASGRYALLHKALESKDAKGLRMTLLRPSSQLESLVCAQLHACKTSIPKRRRGSVSATRSLEISLPEVDKSWVSAWRQAQHKRDSSLRERMQSITDADADAAAVLPLEKYIDLLQECSAQTLTTDTLATSPLTLPTIDAPSLTMTSGQIARLLSTAAATSPVLSCPHEPTDF